MNVENAVAQPNLYTADDWTCRIRRLVVEEAAHRPIVFVVGAGLARDKGDGVWGVGEILSHLKAKYSIEAPAGTPAAEQYGSAMGTLNARHSAVVVEHVVRSAVMAACTVEANDANRSVVLNDRPETVDSDRLVQACLDLQHQVGSWHVPTGITALAELLDLIDKARRDSRRERLPRPPCVITTNFDGLMEIALERQGTPFTASVCAGGGNVEPPGGSITVYHVHGSWTRQPTMHTPWQLTADRARLSRMLRGLLMEACVCVIGYGGWQDLVVESVVGALDQAGPQKPPEVIWAFHALGYTYETNGVLAGLQGAQASCRLTFYEGIDAHSLLPRLAENLRKSSTPQVPAAGPTRTTPPAVEPPRQPENQLVIDLLDATPPGFRAELEGVLRKWDAAPASELQHLVPVVGKLCRVLEQAPVWARRDEFASKARELLDLGVKRYVHTHTPIRMDEGRPQRSEVVTLPGGEAVMADSEHRSMSLSLEERAAVGSTLAFASTSAGLPHAGPSGECRLVDIEAHVWRLLFPHAPTYEKQRDWETLRFELDAMAVRDHRVYVLTQGEKEFEPLAQALAGLVVFVELAKATSPSTDAERTLSALIRQLLCLLRDSRHQGH